MGLIAQNKSFQRNLFHGRKVLFISSNFPPVQGGIAHYIYEIVRNLSRERVIVVALPTLGFERFDCGQTFTIKRLNVPATWNSLSLQFKFLFPFYLWKIIFEKSASIIICDTAHHTLMLPAWLMNKLRGVPYGVFVHGSDLLKQQKRATLYRRLFNKILIKADLVFVNSKMTAKFVQDVGVKPSRLNVIHPPIDAEKYPIKITSKSLREKFELTGNKLILSVGRLVERKGFDTVIKSLPQILKAVPDAHYLIVGSGPYRGKLEKLARELALDKYVTFAGYVSDQELPSFYSACDLFVMVSRQLFSQGDIEGFGIVYLEANLLCKPVVAGRSGGVADAVLHEKTGLLVDPESPGEVAEAIVRLIHEPKLAKQLGVTGRERVLVDFSSKAAAQKVLDKLSLLY
ncbi:glycosyltransferase, group 1 family protein [delta proteobacterium NaphS2]|nr:glycosyltransferase, group 1 family protein [delta proteobacterium NaphS2]